MPNGDLLAIVAAIRAGDVGLVSRLLDTSPSLVSARLHGSRTALHVVTDWPGYYPNGPATVHLLIAQGADPNSRTEGGAPETPLHWAASSDDVDVAEALIDGGADLEAPGGSIGTPLDNAIGYGCWHVARLLVRRGALVDKLWHAAALGLLSRLEELLAVDPAPPRDDINQAFWQACHGAQRRAAEHLLGLGADLTAIPRYARQAAVEIAAGPDTRRELLTSWLQEQGGRAATQATRDHP